jgi:cell fate regulator YaaT (PSP1 superfamily)
MGCASCSSGKDGKPAGCKSNGYCSTSGCNKLDVFDWLAGVPLPSGVTPFDAVEVRFKNTRKGFFRNTANLQLMPGDLVVVDAAPGHDVGMVSLAGELVRLQMERKNAGTDTYELRKVLRKATQEDLDRWHAARKLEDETLFAARKVVADARLDMKVTDVEYQGDGTKATFYYTSEQRVDFRNILRPLSDRFKVKVEMKQIGARQETGRIGGIGSCGRELCCSTWLTDFRSVTTSAARYQQLALNPQKLAGQCGKLKCCLNYELDMYIEAIKSYPSQNAKLKTRQGTGMHMKTDIFTERMWYLFKSPGSASVMAGFPIETVREILAQNKQGIEPDVDLNMVEAEEKAKVPQEATYENVVGQDELTRFDSKIKSGKRTKKRGGKDRKPQGGGGGQQAGPRPQGERGPRPEGQQGERAPRPDRPPRPEGQQGERGPRPEGQPRGDRGRRDRGRGGRDRGPRPDRPQGGGGGGEAPPTPPSA